MFNTLIESKPKKQRRTGGTALSVALHVGVLFFAVAATANARSEAIEKTKAEKLNFVEVKKEPPKKEEPKKEEPKPKPKQPEPVKKAAAPKTPQAPRVEAPAPPKGFQVIQAPVNVPVSIPKIDLSAAVTNEADFSGKGVAGGSSKGVAGGTGDADSKGTGAGEALSTQPYLEFQVEVEASPSGGNPQPEYPSSLRESGVTGRVIVQFVVSKSGRVEPGSIKVLESSNPAFAAAVKAVLPRHRFSPAKIGGTAVRQIVQQPFIFKLQN